MVKITVKTLKKDRNKSLISSELFVKNIHNWKTHNRLKYWDIGPRSLDSFENSLYWFLMKAKGQLNTGTSISVEIRGDCIFMEKKILHLQKLIKMVNTGFQILKKELLPNKVQALSKRSTKIIQSLLHSRQE